MKWDEYSWIFHENGRISTVVSWNLKNIHDYFTKCMNIREYFMEFDGYSCLIDEIGRMFVIISRKITNIHDYVVKSDEYSRLFHEKWRLSLDISRNLWQNKVFSIPYLNFWKIPYSHSKKSLICYIFQGWGCGGIM